MHRSPKYWVRPDEFIPQRWLVEPRHELYPMKGAVGEFCKYYTLPRDNLNFLVSNRHGRALLYTPSYSKTLSLSMF